MSLAFPRQTQNHHQPLQQQQQSRDEESTDKIPAVGDEELQKPLRSTEADIQCHLTPSIITSKDRAPSAAADLSDSNMSDYDYSYDDDDDEKADQTDAMMPEALVVRPRRVEDSNATQAPSAVVDGGVELKRCDRDNNDDDDDSASLADDGQRPAKSRRLDASAPTSSMWVRRRSRRGRDCVDSPTRPSSLSMTSRITRRHQPSAVKMVWRIVGLTDLDVLDADAELVVDPLDPVADRVDGRLRPDPRDVRPRR